MTTTAEQTADGMLFTGEETVNATIAEYKVRMSAVKQRVDEYHADCQRRYATDEYHAAADRLRGAQGWLAGDYDTSYAGPHPSFGVTLLDFRVHYAADSLRAALHSLVWAEHYAGLTDRDAARAADPWNQRS
jgi:hypothetical protein